MTTKHDENIKAIGTMVISNDGFSTVVGQIADHVEDRWGKRHVVLVGDEFREVGYIGPQTMLGIGWKEATAQEVERFNRYNA